MGLRNLVKKYKAYESKELSRRAENKKNALIKNAERGGKVAAYKSLIKSAKPKRKFSGVALTKTIWNPYGVKYPKAKKTLKKSKKKGKRKVKKIIIYK